MLFQFNPEAFRLAQNLDIDSDYDAFSNEFPLIFDMKELRNAIEQRLSTLTIQEYKEMDKNFLSYFK